jgi:hypothetical protein
VERTPKTISLIDLFLIGLRRLNYKTKSSSKSMITGIKLSYVKSELESAPLDRDGLAHLLNTRPNVTATNQSYLP